MDEKPVKKGYYTTTKKVRLYTNHLEYLKLTQDIFNETILKYYDLLLDNIELLNLSNQNCLRELEKLTIKSKTGEIPKNYFEQDIPVYLRRAAINQAIGSVRSYVALLNNYYKNKEKNAKEPHRTTKFDSSIIFYKGMYKEFSNESIQIKLFDGNDWNWFCAKLKGADWDENAELLSPTIIVNPKYVMIHVPIRQIIDDVTPIKQRMEQEHIKICGIAFSNSDSFAVCVCLDENRVFQKSKFIKGGNEYREKTSKILSIIKKHRKANKIIYSEGDHKNYWKKLWNISDYYAHKVSKEIIDFCLENKVSVISITDMNEDITKHFGKKVGKYTPIYLRKRIIQYLEYKAFKNGILITQIRKNYTASKCYICRGNIKRYDLKYECENGHKGDYFFNTAMNIGIMCLKKFGK